ncbi:hypothetical protein BC936DRAFT_143192 [Jimgerdemannia flammicorona]|uniref:Uncharacterized protein n=1 Tax=Jimgerdemannia flammicorona TaxID=994334 RepID=A0A432ZZQ0_9FUNG|nr:hypothetical protein BC936DRAFT_143192 [Jimgerdemannia flammicorona]
MPVSYAEQDLVAIGPDDRPKKRGRPSKKKKSEENEVDNNDMDFVPNKDEKEPVSTDTEAELDDEDISAMNGGAGNLGNLSVMDMKAGVKEKKVKKITAKQQQKQQFSQNPPPPTTTPPPPPPLPLPPPNTSSTGGLMGKFRQIGPIPTPAPPPPAPPLVFKQMMLQPPPMPYRQQIVPKPQDTTTCILCMTIHYGKPCPNMFNGELIRQRLQGLPTLPGVTDADKVILADKLRQLLSQAVEVDRTTHRSSAAAAAASAFNGAASRQPETTASECIICNKYHDGKCPLIDDLDALKRRRDEVNGMSAPNSMRKELLKEIDRHITKASRPLQATLQTIRPTQISRPPQDISESLKFMFGQTPMSNAIPGAASSIPSMCHICQTSPTHPPFLCPMISQPLSLRKRYSEIELDHNISPGKKSELLSTIQVYLSNQVVKERGLGGGGKNLTPFVGTGSTVEQVRGSNGIGQYDMEHSLQQEAQDPVASGLAGEKELDDGAGDVHGNNEHEIIDLT